MDRKTLARAVAKFPGATFIAERNGRSFDVRVMAPRGYNWNEDVHEMVTGGTYGPAEWQTETYREAIRRLESTKPVPCTAETCQSWTGGACEWWADD